MAGGDARCPHRVGARVERGVAGAARLGLEPVPGRRAADGHALEVKRHVEPFREAPHERGVGVRLRAQAVVHVRARQAETQRRPEAGQEVEEGHGVGAAGDGHQDSFAAVEQPMAANAVEDTRGETTGIQTR